MVKWLELVVVILAYLDVTTRTAWCASSSGSMASSIFSSRGGKQQAAGSNMNREYYNQFDDWYGPASRNNTQIPDEQLLIGRLLRNYDPAARPVFNASKPVVIKFGLAFIQICDMVSFFFPNRSKILKTEAQTKALNAIDKCC
jgi:hypothetical protein